MDYARALKFPFADKGWFPKVLIGVLLGLVPIANLATSGYGLEVIRRVASGDTEELPAWDQLGRYFIRGLAVAVASFLYFIPGILLLVILLVAAGQSGLVAGLAGLLFFAYMLAAAFVFPAAMARYALTDEWSSMFDFGWVFGFVGRNFGSYLLMLIVVVVLAVLLGIVGMLALFIGVYVTSFWTVLMFNHLMGQFLRRSPAA